MNLLEIVIYMLIAYSLFKYLMGDALKGYSDASDDIYNYVKDNISGNNDTDVHDNAYKRECDECQPNSANGVCGLTNSVSRDNTHMHNWAPEDLKGKQRIFKYPHYYGYGTGSGFNYGEPYYMRTVDY